jgi:hypothetical protein
MVHLALLALFSTDSTSQKSFEVTVEEANVLYERGYSAAAKGSDFIEVMKPYSRPLQRSVGVFGSEVTTYCHLLTPRALAVATGYTMRKELADEATVESAKSQLYSPEFCRPKFILCTGMVETESSEREREAIQAVTPIKLGWEANGKFFAAATQPGDCRQGAGVGPMLALPLPEKLWQMFKSGRVGFGISYATTNQRRQTLYSYIVGATFFGTFRIKSDEDEWLLPPDCQKLKVIIQYGKNEVRTEFEFKSLQK